MAVISHVIVYDLKISPSEYDLIIKCLQRYGNTEEGSNDESGAWKLINQMNAYRENRMK